MLYGAKGAFATNTTADAATKLDAARLKIAQSRVKRGAFDHAGANGEPPRGGGGSAARDHSALRATPARDRGEKNNSWGCHFFL